MCDDKRSDQISIRAHHLLCTTLFCGHGYSEGFTAGMERLASRLHDGSGHAVRLLAEPDGVCAWCPNEYRLEEPVPNGLGEPVYEGCRLPGNHVIETDRKVLSALRLKEKATYSYDALLEKLEKELTEAAFDDICGDCLWRRQGLCSYEALRAQARQYRQRIVGQDEQSCACKDAE